MAPKGQKPFCSLTYLLTSTLFFGTLHHQECAFLILKMLCFHGKKVWDEGVSVGHSYAESDKLCFAAKVAMAQIISIRLFKTVKYKSWEGAPSVQLEAEKNWSIATKMFKRESCISVLLFFLLSFWRYGPCNRFQYMSNSLLPMCVITCQLKDFFTRLVAD